MKKKKLFLLIFILIGLFYTTSVYAQHTSDRGGEIEMPSIEPIPIEANLCNELPVRRTLLILGVIVDVIKIVVPVILLVKSFIVLFKTTTYGDDKDVKSIFMDLAKPVVVSLLIFFVPEIVEAFVDMIYDGTSSEFEVTGSRCCWACFSNRCLDGGCSVVLSNNNPEG